MPRTYKSQHKRVNYGINELKMALQDVRRGNTLRDVAERYNIPKSTLGKYRNIQNIDSIDIGGGRKTRLSKDDEACLAKYLYECGKYGYGFTKQELLILVKEYCELNGNDFGPGREWYEGFMRRHPELSVRKGEAMSSQRLRGADPFTIKNWYEKLNDLYKKENIGPLDGDRVYNCDESGFCHDPKDVKLIAPKGQKRVSKNIAGSGKKNSTVLACGNANGDKLPPFIIFKGKYVWQNWIPEHDYPGTVYTAQKKGWMEGELFLKWFTECFLPFVKTLEERNNKKVVLIYDGAGVHTSFALSKAAVDNGVVLVKLPANVTHYMQPLDKCVFKPIKTAWNNEMLRFNRDFPGQLLPNSEFSSKLKIIWETSFKSEYLISGFRSTGLFPVNFEKFPTEAFDVVKLQRFRNPDQHQAVNEDEEVPQLQQEHHEQITLPESTRPSAHRFEDFIRFKLTENLTKKASNQKKRKRLSDKVGDILTSKSALKILKEKETGEKQVKDKAKPGPSGISTSNRKTVTFNVKKKRLRESSSSSESDIDVCLESELEIEEFEEEEEPLKDEEEEPLRQKKEEPLRKDTDELRIAKNQDVENIESGAKDIKTGEFVQVKFLYNQNAKNETVKIFAAKTLQIIDDRRYKLSCMRSYKGSETRFIFPQVPDDVVVDSEQIIALLPNPRVTRGVHIFE